MRFAFNVLQIQDELTEAIPEPSLVLETLQDMALQAAGPALRIGIIIVGSLLVLRLMRGMIRRMVERLMERGDQQRREVTLKANTLASVIESAGRFVVLLIAGMMVLSELGQDIAPLIASAGVVGLAVGLGAQSLIKDLIGGFFILFEDQYSVGDVINVNGHGGVVEYLSLRRTSLRALNGSFIVIPNGDIRVVSNLTKDWSRALIDVNIGLDQDIDHAIAVLQELLADIETDPEIGDAILEPAEILGVEALGEYHITLRLIVKTVPMQQWRVQRELRRRIKAAFNRAGVTIPYPHNVTLFRATGSEDFEPSSEAVALMTAAERQA